MGHKLDYQGTINFKNDLGLQEVYSSQNYGTFYSIYMSFDCEKDETNILLKNVKFELINYKGVINLGIVSVKWNPRVTREEIGFKIKVEAMVKEKSFSFSPEKEFKINVDRFSKFVIERELLEMSCFDPEKGPNENLVFDDEFYYRDGLEFNPESENNIRLKRGGMEGSGIGSSGKRCYQIFHKMIF